MQGPSPKSNLKSHKLISSTHKNITMTKSSTITKNTKLTSNLNNNNNSNNKNAKGSFIKNTIINSNSLFKPEQHNQIKTSTLLRNKKLKDKKQIIKKNLTINPSNVNNISHCSNNNNNNNKEKKDLDPIKNFHSAINSGGLNNIKIPNKNNNLIQKKEMLNKKDNKSKISNYLINNNNNNNNNNNITNYRVSNPQKNNLNINPNRKNQLNKIKSATNNNKIQNTLKKPLIITSTNSIEKIMINHRKMELNNNIKNNKNFNLKNSSLNEESQKEIIKGNQTNLKKNNIINRRNKNNNLLNNINDNNNNPIEYGKIFGLLNHEIKEITDLFKRTQSEDQQKNKDKDILYTEENNFTPNLIESDLFENDEENFEKMIDISQLENEVEENKNKSHSILFSSYNSELYKNLINNGNNEGDEIIDNEYTNLSANSLRNNIVQIAKNNINYQEEENNFNRNLDDKSIINDKTECQFIDIDFNKEIEGVEIKNYINEDDSNGNILDGIDSEKTDTIIDETNNTHSISKNIPIQEIMQKIRGS